jgi:hypothetical protein
MKTKTVIIDEANSAWLDKRAEETGASYQFLANQAIRAYREMIAEGIENLKKKKVAK